MSGVIDPGIFFDGFLIGMWLSLVEHSVRDAGVGGSNPLIPTIQFKKEGLRPPFFLLVLAVSGKTVNIGANRYLKMI